MLPEFITVETIYLIAHVFGAILGAGGAFASDAIFFKTVKDGVIDTTELGFMKLMSKLVWAGVFILIASGILLFSTNPAGYLDSSKFLVKVTIVAVIVINGVIFHLIHLPHISKHVGLKINESPTFLKKSTFLMASGAVSMVSWISTVILGMLRKTPYSYLEILSLYLLMVIFAITVSLLTKKKILNINQSNS
jgi:uncharacterized membrane protein